MGNRRVRCRYTGEYGRSGQFHRVEVNGKNEYYKSKKVYLKSEKEKRLKQEINRLVAIDILDYDGNQFLPPFFLKRINDLGESYPFEVVLSTFTENIDTLKYWMSQENKFKNESGKLNYMMAIVKSKINDEYEKWKTKKRREEVDNKVEIDIDLLDVEIKHRKSDGGISEFL